MRQYALLYNKERDDWSVIYKDDFESEWYVEESGLSERGARAMLKGFQVD